MRAQVEAFVRHLTLSPDVVTSVAEIDGYALLDLVEVPGLTDGTPQAGVIVVSSMIGRHRIVI